MSRTVQGIKYTWQVGNEPIGSGDAGEIFTVKSLEQPNLTGVLKKPARVATLGTIQRQAGQISREAKALFLLNGLPEGKAHPPQLLDQAPDHTHGTANYFMISESAPGDDLTALLTQTQQRNKPFPRRIIITVLDALFDMLSRAHEVGVLWNDVKLEHIFWHNSSEQITVIDWGNTLFLDQENSHSPTRWEDFQQLVDTLGGFLLSTAPELYEDLGWDEFQGKTLGLSLVSVLAKRISYQQQVIAHQVMEYQSLLRLALGAKPSLEGLRMISNYSSVLEKIGVTREDKALLTYSKSLIEFSLAKNNRQSVVAAVAQVWEIFNDTLDLPWHLVREYCHFPNIITHERFNYLVKHTLNTNWSETLWEASTIASQTNELTWWERIIPVLRQAALRTTNPTPYQVCQNFQGWAENHRNEYLAGKLKAITQTWRNIGCDLKESPFSYAVLDFIQNEQNLPVRFTSEVKQSFVLGEAAIRELEAIWTQADFDALPGAFRKIISWDPDRWGVLALAEQVKAFQKWLSTLHTGPKDGVNSIDYLINMRESRPKLENLLGSPTWLSRLINMLNNIHTESFIIHFQSEIRKFCPWMLFRYDAENTPTDDNIPPGELSTWLLHLLGHLKSWSDVDAALVDIQIHTPQVFELCSQLVNGFNFCLSLNADVDRIRKISAEPFPSELNEAIFALESLIDWRELINKQDLSSACSPLLHDTLKGWEIIEHTHQATMEWGLEVIPLIQSILSFEAPSAASNKAVNQKHRDLSLIVENCLALKSLWMMIYDSGIHFDLLNTLGDHIDLCRIYFLKWQKSVENSSDTVTRLLYHSQIAIIKSASELIMNLTHHIHQAKLAFTSFQNASHATFTVQMRNIERLFYHLTFLEQTFVLMSKDWRFPSYSLALNEFFKAETNKKRQAIIAALPENHPFYTWLVKSTLN